MIWPQNETHTEHAPAGRTQDIQRLGGWNLSVAFFFSERVRNDLAEIQGVTIWSLLVPWLSAAVVCLSVAFF